MILIKCKLIIKFFSQNIKKFTTYITELNRESSKPSRMIKTKYKRTKINKATKTKAAETKEIDPLVLINVMAK
jgi:hypothetical protein